MKKGIYTWFGFVLPFEEKLRLIKAAGFETICTWWDDLFEDLDGKKEYHFEQAAKAGLLLEHTHLPYFGCNALWCDGLNGEELTKRYCKGIEGAADSGIKTVVMHPFEGQAPVNGNWKAAEKHIRTVAECSAKNRVRLAVENIGDKYGFIKIVELLDDNPYAGICFDVGHNHITTPNDFEILKLFDNKVFALHVHDNHAAADEHLLPQEGTVDWKGFMSALNKTSFTGSFMLESCYPLDLEGKSSCYIYHEPPISPKKYLEDAGRRSGDVLKYYGGR